MRSLEGLNPQQREVVTHGDGPLLVLAGAGSGKTRALTNRIAHLIEARGARPSSILAVTFTNKAAGEMRERIEALLGDVAHGVWAGTFHSICLKLLRMYGGRIGLDPRFTVYDETDRMSVLKRLVRELHLGDGGFEPRSLSSSLSDLKNRGIDPRDPDAELTGPMSDRRLEVLRGYQKALQEGGGLDFDDLLLFALRLLDEDPQLTERLRTSTCTHVLVDEFQDTNKVQYDLVRRLAGAGDHLMAVGDDDQAIYGWRGADLENLRRFEEHFPGTRVVLLEQNYRSTTRILDAAHSVISADADRHGKKLWSDRGEGERVVLHSARDDREEARFVVNTILRLARREGRQSSDFAIFYRTNAQSRTLEDELLHWNLPYVVVGGTRFYDRAEIKDALAYLRALLSPHEPVSLRRILNKPTRGIGATSVERIDAMARREGIPWTEAVRRASTSEEIPGGARRSIGKLVAWLDELRAAAEEGLGPVALLRRLLEESGYLESLEQDDSPEAQGRIENLDELLSVAGEFEENYPGQPAQAFLDEVTLVSDVDKLDAEQGRISLMTLHTAKGLEFPVVFVVGLEEQLVPHSRSMNVPSMCAEERRLLYVGMTRGRERLFLVHAGERMQHGERRPSVPSRFLDDLDLESLELSGEPGIASVRSLRSRSRAAASDDEPSWPSADGGSGADDGETVVDASSSQEEMTRLTPGPHVRVGMMVIHPTFGPGTIRRVEDRGDRQKVMVQFARGGYKKLLVRLANLAVPG